jgi:hypothetical protein
MRPTLILLVIFASLSLRIAAADARGHGGSGSGGGSHSVGGYTTKRGTYVAPHMQTNPNGTKLDNWSTKGNVNPYTGRPGTKKPD